MTNIVSFANSIPVRCAGSSYTYYNFTEKAMAYPAFAQTSNTTNCVSLGGASATFFTTVPPILEVSPVSKIRFYFKGSVIVGIQVYYWNYPGWLSELGICNDVGLGGITRYQIKNFSPGELLRGFVIGVNETTSKLQHFTGLLGFKDSNNYFTSIGVLTSQHPVESIVLSNSTYVFKNPSVINPSTYVRYLCNNNPTPQTMSFTFAYTEGRRNCFSSEATSTKGYEAGFEVGVPAIKSFPGFSGEAKYEWETSTTFGTSGCSGSTETKSFTESYTIANWTAYKISAIQVLGSGIAAVSGTVISSLRTPFNQLNGVLYTVTRQQIEEFNMNCAKITNVFGNPNLVECLEYTNVVQNYQWKYQGYYTGNGVKDTSYSFEFIQLNSTNFEEICNSPFAKRANNKRNHLKRYQLWS